MNHSCLADVPGVARVEKCGACEELHLSIGPVSLRIAKEMLGPLCHVLEEAWASLQSAPCEPKITVITPELQIRAGGTQ